MSVFGSLFNPSPQAIAREIIKESERIAHAKQNEAFMRIRGFEVQQANPGSIGAKFHPKTGWEPIWPIDRKSKDL